MALPQNCQKLRLVRQGPALTIWMNDPPRRNALGAQMAQELAQCFDALKHELDVRVVILRGAQGFFCAGGDLKNFLAQSTTQTPKGLDAIAIENRRGGALMQAFDALPQATITAVEGAAMGGGFGLAAIADIGLATADAKFAMSEVLVGVIPAQISPFVVRRIGYNAAKRLAITGASIDGAGACALGLVAETAENGAGLDPLIEKYVRRLLASSPYAVARTKELMNAAYSCELPLDKLLDEAAEKFSDALRNPEGVEGATAFAQKRKPAWVVDWRLEPSE